MKRVSNIPIPDRVRTKYNTIRQEYTIPKLGVKIPIGVIAIEALSYVTDKVKSNELKFQIDNKEVKLIENEKS